MVKSNNDTFIKVTNKDIYDKLLVIEKHVLDTNSKVKMNKWIASTAMTLVILSLGFLFNHTAGGLI